MQRIARVVAALWCAALVGCGGGSEPTSNQPAGPSQAEEDKLNQFWSDPGKSDLGAYGAMYDSWYTNMGLTGVATAGQQSVTFAMFGGYHTDDFPWPDAKSWVSIGLLIGDQGYNYVGQPGVGFTITPVKTDGTIDFIVKFAGSMTRAGTTDAVPVEFEFPLTARAFVDWEIGFAQLGMVYRPARLTTRPDATTQSLLLSVAGTSHSVDPVSVIGEVEQGDVWSVNYRGAYYKYEYCSLANPTTGKSFTSFTTKLLTEESSPVLAGGSQTLSEVGSKAFTLARDQNYAGYDHPCVEDKGATCAPDWKLEGEPNPDNPEAIVCPPFGSDGVLFEHTVNLGQHSDLKRQMFRARGRSGADYLGLREVFLPKTDVWGNPCSTRYCGDVPATE